MIHLHDKGEEAFIKDFFVGLSGKDTTLYVGLFHNATDDLSDGDDIGAISTEPQGSSYSRQPINIEGSGSPEPSPVYRNGDWGVDMPTVSFDLSDSSQAVDAYFFAMDFQADGETSANTHLIASGRIATEYPADTSSIDIGGSGLVQS